MAAALAERPSAAGTLAATRGPRWYCVHTKSRAEHIALANLERQAFECFLPRLARTVIRARRRQRVLDPLFPGYLFLHADPAQANLAAVRSTRGALGLVRFTGEPAVVEAPLIERLRADADEAGIIAPEQPRPKAGDAITVLDGPFIGLRGIYSEARGEHRALVLLQLLGGAQPVVLAADAIETPAVASAS